MGLVGGKTQIGGTIKDEKLWAVERLEYLRVGKTPDVFPAGAHM